MGHRKQGLAKELLPLQLTTHCYEASSGATVAAHFPFYVQFSGPRPIPVAETLLYEIATVPTFALVPSVSLCRWEAQLFSPPPHALIQAGLQKARPV